MRTNESIGLGLLEGRLFCAKPTKPMTAETTLMALKIVAMLVF